MLHVVVAMWVADCIAAVLLLLTETAAYKAIDEAIEGSGSTETHILKVLRHVGVLCWPRRRCVLQLEQQILCSTYTAWAPNHDVPA